MDPEGKESKKSGKKCESPACLKFLFILFCVNDISHYAQTLNIDSKPRI